MKLGFFVTNQYLPGESMSEKIEESSEQVRAARDAGFSLIATGQHYLAAPYQMSTSLTLLARLAAFEATIGHGQTPAPVTSQPQPPPRRAASTPAPSQAAPAATTATTPLTTNPVASPLAEEQAVGASATLGYKPLDAFGVPVGAKRPRSGPYDGKTSGTG